MRHFITSLQGLKPIHQRFLLEGQPIVPGYAIGRVFHYRDILSRELEIRDLEPHQVEGESRRIEKALEKVHQDLAMMKKRVESEIDREHAQIFEVHQHILKDLQIVSDIERGLRDRLVNAEQIVQEVFKKWEKRLLSAVNKKSQERASDVADLGRRILKALTGVDSNLLSDIPARSVIFAKRLLPSDTIHLKEKNVEAIVTKEGSRNSHSAILAKALDIPFISEIEIQSGLIPEGALIVVDGDNGRMIVNAHPSEMKRYLFKTTQSFKYKTRIARQSQKMRLEYEGKAVKVGANVATLDDFKNLKKYACDGVGLYRIESIYMGKTHLLSENYLYAQLRGALDSIPRPHKEVTLRLLDIGGDKPLPYLDIEEVMNPGLGLRGVRVLLKYPTLLRTQLRVCLRLAREFDLKVLVPMVSIPDDVLEVRKHLEEVKTSLAHEKVPYGDQLPLGAMIETPSAVMMIDEIAQCSDLLSLGTNDLIQYLMAADREKRNVAQYFEFGNSLVLQAIKQVVKKAEEKEIDCSLCGELAGDLRFTEELLHLGLRNFSVVPSLAPLLKNKIHSILRQEALAIAAC